MGSLPLPTEAQEQIALVQYLKAKGYLFFRVPNETFTKSWKQKSMNTALGVVKGVPDLFVFKGNQKFAIEMKRLKGGVTSPEQKEWLRVLASHGFEAAVCHGAVEAIDFIEGER